MYLFMAPLFFITFFLDPVNISVQVFLALGEGFTNTNFFLRCLSSRFLGSHFSRFQLLRFNFFLNRYRYSR